MKIRVTFKTPDAIDEAINAADFPRPEGLDDEEWETVLESRLGKLRQEMSRFFEYDEYVTVEYNTETRTCVVVPLF